MIVFLHLLPNVIFKLPHLFAIVSLFYQMSLCWKFLGFLDVFMRIEAIISPLSAIYHLLPWSKNHNWKFRNSLISKYAYKFYVSHTIIKIVNGRASMGVYFCAKITQKRYKKGKFIYIYRSSFYSQPLNLNENLNINLIIIFCYIAMYNSWTRSLYTITLYLIWN